MKPTLPLRTTLQTAVLVACAGGILLAKTRDPTIFELAYADLAVYLHAPELCEKIGRDTVEHGPIFGERTMRIRYVESECYYDMALNHRNLAYCERVRTISTFWRDGSGMSAEACRSAVASGPHHYGGLYAVGLLLNAMGFSDDDINTAMRDRPESMRVYEFMTGSSHSNDIRARLARLPDFSRGDAEARRQLFATLPHCASRFSRSFECRRARCALERAQPGGLACERGLSDGGNPWD